MMDATSKENNLEYITVPSLLDYGVALAHAPRVKDATGPPEIEPSPQREKLVSQAKDAIKGFVARAQTGFPNAETYRSERGAILQKSCEGDALVFFAAWNMLLAEGGLTSLLRAPIGAVQKPPYRRLAAIVPREHLTPRLVEGRIILDLGDDRFWLLPRDLTGRTLLFTLRHGYSRVDSKTRRVGKRLANELDPEQGFSKAAEVGKALAQMLGLIGGQLDFHRLPNYLDPKSFSHRISNSPNTQQLFERVYQAICPDSDGMVEPVQDPTLESQDFGWATGMDKKFEVQEAARIFGCDEKSAKRLIKNPLYAYPGGNSFFDLYVDVIDGFHRLAKSNEGQVVCLYTHSSTLRALVIYLDPRPFQEAFSEFGEYKEKQDNVVLLAAEQGHLMGYSTAVGLSAREQGVREAWVTVERERKDRVTLKPRTVRQVIALVSGGDFAGGGAVLKELRVTGERFGLEVYIARHGFLGLANNWIERISERETRGLASQASCPIGSSRFEDFKDERVQNIAFRHLEPYLDRGVLIVIGGDGTFRGARALFEGFGVQVIGLPGTIDNNIDRTTSLGYHSALALADHSLESLKATSAAMGSVFFVEIMGAGSGHLTLACGFQARAEGVLVNEHPDPDGYIDEVILNTLKRTLGVPNKSHLFVVAEKTPHRHHPEGGVHGLTEYVGRKITEWRKSQPREGIYSLPIATKATILGHTLRGAPPTPEDKALGQFLGYEAIKRLMENPESIIGCFLACQGSGPAATIPLHAVAPKPFDWDLFTRMHGSESFQLDKDR